MPSARLDFPLKSFNFLNNPKNCNANLAFLVYFLYVDISNVFKVHQFVFISLKSSRISINKPVQNSLLM